MSDYTLFLGDCLEYMKTMEPGSVDAVITDPPFNVGKKYGTATDKRKDYGDWCSEWIAECFRIVSSNGVVCIKNIVRNLPVMFREMEKHGSIVNQIIWRNVSANHNKRSFWNAYESILVYSKSDEYIFNTYAQTQLVSKPSWSIERRARQKNQMRDIWDDIKNIYSGSVNHPEVIHANDGTNSKAHPCQQPIDLSRRLIEFFTNEGLIVFDPFMGIGTTGVASIKSKRDFIGCEIDPNYYAIAERRIKQAAAQMLLPLEVRV